jgi:hypothetical protein
VRAAITYGDLEFAVDPEPKGQPLHGYTEYRILVRNRGSEATRHVRLTMPGDAIGGRRRGALVDISRSVEVGPGLTISVSLLQPAHPDVAGGGVAVTIDGRRQDKLLSISPVSSRGRSGGMYGYGYPRYGRRSMRFYSGPSMSGPGDGLPLILTSQRVPEKFFQRTVAVGPVEPEAEPEIVMGRPGFADPRSGLHINADFNRSDLPISAWSSRWLGYTRYDAIVVLREDLEELQRGSNETRAVLQALWQFTETGGVLIVIGPGQVAVPPGWRSKEVGKEGLTLYAIGFGQCFVTPDREPEKWAPDRWAALGGAIRQTATPFQSSAHLLELNKAFPVVDDLGVPVKGLFALIILFAVALGPINLAVLGRKNKRIWMLWTVPLLSFLTCLAVFGYMIVAEGWQGRARVGGITFLNEIDRRATTLGRTAFYSPLTPGGGLHFSENTEVSVPDEDAAVFSNSCTIDWTQGQHLGRGWVTARVPAHFFLRKSEPRRERLTLHRDADGALQLVNALPADIKTVWVADEKGMLYSAGKVAAGQRVSLERSGKYTLKPSPPDRWRRLYANSDWVNTALIASQRPADVLGPRMYLAVVEGSPFLEQGLQGAAVRESASVVLGVMAEGGQ